MLSFISNTEVNRLVTWDILVPALHESLLAYYAGSSTINGVVQPLRTRMKIEKHSGELLLMPAFISKNDILAVKLLTLYPDNGEKKLPTHSGLIILFDGATGIPRTLVDSQSITALRTASVSALVSKLLGHENCQRIAILGSGIQGRSHARAVYHVIQPSMVCIWSRNFANAVNLVADLKKEGINAECFDLIEKCVENCDIISTCTLSATPILKKDWLGKQTHINAIGAASPNLQELDPAIMQSAKVYVDSIESAKSESGDVILSGITEFENLEDLLQSKKAPEKSGITVFKNLGLAVEDATAAGLAFKLYNEEMKGDKF